jgi:transposase
MALGRQCNRQSILIGAAFDTFVEGLCHDHYAAVRGRPSLPPGRCFRMLLIGYFEGIDSERGLEWRCSDSLSLREFLRLTERESVPDRSWLSRTRSRLPLELHEQVFSGVLQRLAEHGLIGGERIGVDAATKAAVLMPTGAGTGASGLNLLVTAIILWNTRYLHRASLPSARPATTSGPPEAACRKIPSDCSRCGRRPKPTHAPRPFGQQRSELHYSHVCRAWPPSHVRVDDQLGN